MGLHNFSCLLAHDNLRSYPPQRLDMPGKARCGDAHHVSLIQGSAVDLFINGAYVSPNTFSAIDCLEE
jgi:hypothetical protein